MNVTVVVGNALLVLGGMASANSLAAQTVAQRVAEIRDGRVRMSFAAREGVCWSRNGNTISTRRESEDWITDCEPGPVRVVLSVADGRVTDLDTYVAGRWRDRPATTDLGDVPVAEAVDYLLGLATTADEEVAEHALFPVSMADSVTVWPEMARIARDRSRPLEVRKQAIFWTGQNSDDDAVDALSDIFDSSNEHEIQERAIFALSQHGSERAGAVLRDIATSERETHELRERAVFWLGQRRGDDESAEFLRELYRETADTELRERIIFSLSQMRNVGNEGWLRALAMDDDEPLEQRKRAVFWMGQMRQSTSDMIDLYDAMDNPEMRERIVFSLSQKRRDPEAMDKLIAIATDDPDRELRGRAIFWLGQSRDPRAAAFLAELINR